LAELIPEDAFAAQYPSGFIQINVTVPADNTAQGIAWGLLGQVLSMSVPIKTLIKDLKDMITMQLKDNVSRLVVVCVVFVLTLTILSGFCLGNTTGKQGPAERCTNGIFEGYELVSFA
jgi:hypothetical protein